MVNLVIYKDDAGQRLDKYLHRYLKSATNGFLYKMMRKKNITLNHKKCEGSQLLQIGDSVQFYLSEETLLKFGMQPVAAQVDMTYTSAYRQQQVERLYESEDYLILNKPKGMLSQSDSSGKYTINDWIQEYLRVPQGAMFRPGVCHRLDQNTSGIILCAKNLPASRQMSCWIKEHALKKTYRCVIKGTLPREGIWEGYLYKDIRHNKTTVYQSIQEHPQICRKDLQKIITNYRTVCSKGGYSLVEAELITGKSHQIRSQLASAGYPLVGDVKYGGEVLVLTNKTCVNSQMLHAYKMVFPNDRIGLQLPESGEVICKEPSLFQKVMGING